MKPKHQRLLFVLFSLGLLVCAVLLTLRAFSENLIFFYSPSDLKEKQVEVQSVIRVGGLVKAGSVVHTGANDVSFVVTDGASDVAVSYQGVLPNLFREGQGVVAEGTLENPANLKAKTILAKHDESYMPREVVDALKRSGHWKDAR
jgi:cytochrome c-type biogenesis protein CcmE